MMNRGENVLGAIRKRFNATRWINVLMTTQYYDGEDLASNNDTPAFRLYDSVLLSDMWPDHVKMLRIPF